MTDDIRLTVYRRLDNRLQNMADDSSLAWELHRRRRAALEQAVGEIDSVLVIDWGSTRDEEQTHEVVELVLQVLATPALHAAATAAVIFVGQELVKAGAKEAVSRAATRLLTGLRREQAAQKIQDFNIAVHGVKITCFPSLPDAESATITVRFDDGWTLTVQYDAAKVELPASPGPT